MKYLRIPKETVRRLPFYLRGLLRLSDEGVTRVSSQDVAGLLGVKPWLVRKDLSYFGDFGKPGVGYDLAELIQHIRAILKLDRANRAVLVGAGSLGSALLEFPGFEKYGLEIAFAFDCDPQRIGGRIGGVVIEDVAHLASVEQRDVNLGIVAVPQQVAQEVVDTLVHAGIKGLLSFSSLYIVAPDDVKVLTIDIAMDLARLPYYLSSPREKKS
jgi:redox-sensing transcriptional repressor